MEARFSPRVKDVITYSREEALRLGHDYIGTEHLLLGLVRDGEGMAIRVLISLGINLQELRHNIENSIKPTTKKTTGLGNIPLIRQAEKALKLTYLEAKVYKAEEIGTEHLLLSILKDEDSVATQTLKKFNVDYKSVKDELDFLISGEKKNLDIENRANPLDDDDDAEQGGFGGGAGSGAKKVTDSK